MASAPVDALSQMKYIAGRPPVANERDLIHQREKFLHSERCGACVYKIFSSMSKLEDKKNDSSPAIGSAFCGAASTLWPRM